MLRKGGDSYIAFLSNSTLPPQQVYIARKVGLELDPFSPKKYRVAEGGFFLEYGLLVKKGGKRSTIFLRGCISPP